MQSPCDMFSSAVSSSDSSAGAIRPWRGGPSRRPTSEMPRMMNAAPATRNESMVGEIIIPSNTRVGIRDKRDRPHRGEVMRDDRERQQHGGGERMRRKAVARATATTSASAPNRLPNTMEATTMPGDQAIWRGKLAAPSCRCNASPRRRRRRWRRRSRPRDRRGPDSATQRPTAVIATAKTSDSTCHGMLYPAPLPGS